jgi:3-hydroxy-9,10-secoandrosta-1,3,5(10)-triene-9,17-dione monooxygenase reductase component
MAGQLSDTTALGPTPAEWRLAMGAFPTGVAVVTSWRGESPVGSTVNALCSVSLSPPLLLICLDRTNPICAPLEGCGVFGVNVLPHEGGPALAIRFSAAPEAERFTDLRYSAARPGAPQFDVAPVFIDCVVEGVHPGGDHLIYVGRGVRAVHASGVAPLLYHRGAFPGLTLGS